MIPVKVDDVIIQPFKWTENCPIVVDDRVFLEPRVVDI
jgi:hypothetical protein